MTKDISSVAPGAPAVTALGVPCCIPNRVVKSFGAGPELLISAFFSWSWPGGVPTLPVHVHAARLKLSKMSQQSFLQRHGSEVLAIAAGAAVVALAITYSRSYSANSSTVPASANGSKAPESKASKLQRLKLEVSMASVCMCTYAVLCTSSTAVCSCKAGSSPATHAN